VRKFTWLLKPKFPNPKTNPNMKLTELLAEKKTAIVDRWLKLVFASYPGESALFLHGEKDRFQNPMGYRLTEGIHGLFEALLQDLDAERVKACLDEVIRIRAIQDFSPAQALAFIFLLKNVIREELAAALADAALAQEVLELESRIDGVALLGFDVYMKRREKLYEIRVEEIKNRIGGLLRKAGLSVSNP